VSERESGVPRIEPPSVDVTPGTSSALPGEHRGGFQREFTEPVPIAETAHADVEWSGVTPVEVATPALPRSVWWAFAFAVVGLGVSFFVGWGFLIGLFGAGFAIASLRRPWESRRLAVWALCLSVLSLVFSAGWLWWASTQGPLFG
jgi:hypothetical protein